MLHFSVPRNIVHYQSRDGRIPFRLWLDTLRDIQGKAHILNRIDRMEDGNLGQHRSVGAGVIELKINTGPGYRVYIGQKGIELIVLLCGGDKRTQGKDIGLAKRYWQDYRSRT